MLEASLSLCTSITTMCITYLLLCATVAVACTTALTLTLKYIFDRSYIWMLILVQQGLRRSIILPCIYAFEFGGMHAERSPAYVFFLSLNAHSTQRTPMYLYIYICTTLLESVCFAFYFYIYIFFSIRLSFTQSFYFFGWLFTVRCNSFYFFK